MLQRIDKLLEPDNPETAMAQAWVIFVIIVVSMLSYGIYEVLSNA